MHAPSARSKPPPANSTTRPSPSRTPPPPTPDPLFAGVVRTVDGHAVCARCAIGRTGARAARKPCTIDRRGDQPIDQIEIACPNLEPGQQVLGEPNSLQVTMGDAGRVQANVNLKTVGDQIAGTIVLKYSNVSFHVDKLNELAGGKIAALQMNEGVTAIKNFQSTIKVSGPVDQPLVNATSDLGTQFAGAVNRALREKRTKRLPKTDNLFTSSVNRSKPDCETTMANDLSNFKPQSKRAKFASRTFNRTPKQTGNDKT